MLGYGLIEKLHSILPAERIFKDEPMDKHTTFRAGGRAGVLVQAATTDELKKLLALIRGEDIPFFILGRGSNLLVSDRGYDGMIINLTGELADVILSGCDIRAGAGASLRSVAMEAMKASLSGMEFAAGIPGTVGGAVFMNAGAYGGEISQIITTADVMDHDGSVRTMTAEELRLSYRSSILRKEPLICLCATFGLKNGNSDEIRDRIEELSRARREKQPLEYPSAGSTFKRPEGYFAGKLIMDAQLSGCRVGGASVSEKHCGFIINDGNATAADIKKLMDLVQERVFSQFGVRLEPEVCLLGDF